MSSSSRPSSSLSQRSSSNGIADQDQQVSFQLEKFEEASLRGSLSRWTYRDPYSSPQFAVNPLLLMEIDVSTEPSDRDHEKIDHSNETFSDIPDSVECAENVTERIDGQIEGIVDDNKEAEYFNINGLGNDTESLAANDDILKLASNELSRKIAYNPLYEPEKTQRSDHDSGTYSVDTNHAEENKKQEEDRWRRLWIDDDQERSSTKNDQILSFNGKRYWTLNGCKYHTFGGIKDSFNEKLEVEDSDEDNSKVEARDEPFDIVDFGKFKFQTFGGIKKSKRIDGKGIPMYRRVTLTMRSSCKKAKGMRCSHSDSVLYKCGSDENVDRQSDWQSDYESDSSEEKDKTKYLDVNKKRKRNNKLCKWQTKAVYCSSRRSSSDESWQDEDAQSTDKTITRKFLRDASPRKVKSRSNSDNDSNYFLNTSRRKVFDGSLRRGRCQKRSSDNNESLKLEPPIVPEVVEKTFETLQDLRRRKRKKKKRESSVSNERKKIGVRSLSDLTIW